MSYTEKSHCDMVDALADRIASKARRALEAVEESPSPSMAECLTGLDLRMIRVHALNELSISPLSVNADDKLRLVLALEDLGEDIRYLHARRREERHEWQRIDKLARSSVGDCHP